RRAKPAPLPRPCDLEAYDSAHASRGVQLVERGGGLVEGDDLRHEAVEVELAVECRAREEREVLLRDRVAAVRDGDADLGMEEVELEVDVERAARRRDAD